MVAVSEIAHRPTTPSSAVPSAGPDPLAAYRADWAAPGAGLAAAPVAALAAAAPAAPRPGDDGSVHSHALLAADVYRDSPAPPDGYRVATEDELARLGLDPDQLDPGTGFRARVYAETDADGGYVVAFRGSQQGSDWLTNARQGVGLDSDHYARALEIGRIVGRNDEVVTMTGHSLGGGLASTAALASGAPADTFNAAGLHGDTLDAARAVAGASGAGAPRVDNWRVPGELLTALQEGGDRAVGAGLGGLVTGGLLGAGAGAALVDLPEAHGRQHALPDVAPDGVGWLGSLNPVARHGIDWVLAGTAALGR